MNDPGVAVGDPHVEVDLASAVPPYEQIRAQVTHLALLGALPAGARLPPVRQLAAHLGVSNGVVARAYRQLEQEGVVVTAGRHGTSISPLGQRLQPAEADQHRHRLLEEAASVYAAQAQRLGFEAHDAHRALTMALDNQRLPTERPVLTTS